MGQIISFDGLNRSGKGTQISKMKEHLESLSVPVGVLRGDGSRPGKGLDNFTDPSSDWWKIWQANNNKNYQDWNLAYQVLSNENEDKYASFISTNPEGVLLMDRCYLSRWFMLRQQDKDTKFEDAFLSTNLHPEQYFVIDVPKDVLLERVSDDDYTKTEFRRENVRRGYDLWQDTINRAEDYLKEKMIRLDGTKSPDKLHNIISLSIDISLCSPTTYELEKWQNLEKITAIQH
ncbi:hypothetical protein HON71_01585 [Candidatus Woesearchaeota archaeon]|jgi:thymidylate kinase|nr:hypothetical protein [Candidatus Woesearchaeota archaeon]MBT5343075.1 hypothetical protein [Candidatus Woesearchaeota archaeon]